MKDQGTPQGPQGQGAAPERDSNGGGGMRERIVALETQREHLATRADLTEQVSKLREDTNRQFNELRKENTELREDMNRQFNELRKENAKLREDMSRQFAELREENAKMREEMREHAAAQREEMARQREEMARQMAAMHQQVATIQSSTSTRLDSHLRWMIALWLGAASAIVGLLLHLTRGTGG